MKINIIIRAAIIISLSLFAYACNNVGYEIEETDNGGQNSSTNTSPATNDDQEKHVIKNTPIPDDKNSTAAINDESSKQIPVKTYAIQLGAFTNELTAQKFSDKAKSSLNIDINSTQIGGWYKIKAGVFNSISDAETELEIIREQGYPDSFISETGK